MARPNVPAPPTGSVVFGYEADGLRSLWRVDLPSNESIELVRSQRGSSVSPDGRHFAWVETLPGEDDQVHLADAMSLLDVVVPTDGQVWATQHPTTTVPTCYGCPNSTFTWSPGGRWVSWVDCADVESCHMVVSASDGSSRKVLQPSFFAREVNQQAWLFWQRDDQLIVRLPGHDIQLADGDGANIRVMPDGMLRPYSPDGQWTVEGSDSGLTIMAQDGTVKTRATFAGEEHIPVMWAPDSSIFTVSFVGDYDPRHHQFDHLGLVGIDGHVTRVDVSGGIDFVPRDIRTTPDGAPVRWSPDSSRLVAYGTIVGRDGRIIETLADVGMAAWSWDSHHLAVAGSAASGVSVVDADGSHRQEFGAPSGAPAAAEIDQLVWVP